MTLHVSYYSADGSHFTLGDVTIPYLLPPRDVADVEALRAIVLEDARRAVPRATAAVIIAWNEVG